MANMMHPGRVVPGIGCPTCGAEILYNGNYFCSELDQGCTWINPAVFLGRYTIAEANFADALVAALTGRPAQGGLQQYATDAKPRRRP